ncbi:alpha/beta fold hydrolase [Kutzneria sp. CA-103260]|uniref:alpha/beta fold hydrolase n=1 Tax=Kutzneria sp. CA-103260 TaxID=2802641 RepID=UPI001BA70748|nr:alpha/beta hydrolase [Kutzneria sp. CA-103260]QUQ64515.1 Haloalkane dehalogenase [Kutzneria sp. CA-103260]
MEPFHRLIGMNRHDITVHGNRITAYEAGDGPETILLVHGIPDSSAVYRHQVPGLLAAGYRVVVPDLLGHGDSDIPVGTEHYTITRDEESLWAVADALDASTFHLVGHDRGALSTWSMAASRPDRVTSYVAMSVGHPANANPANARGPVPRVSVSTLGIWPTADPYCGLEQIARSVEWMDGPWRFARLEGAGHFLQLDRPDAVTQLILDHIAVHATERTP